MRLECRDYNIRRVEGWVEAKKGSVKENFTTKGALFNPLIFYIRRQKEKEAGEFLKVTQLICSRL